MNEAKKMQNGRLKKSEFFKITNSQIIFKKISHIGPWVSMELIDVKGIYVSQHIYIREAVRHKLKNSQKTQKMHF